MGRGALRVRCTVEYDGSDFAGWQRQTDRRSVQGTLEEAIAAVTGDGAARVVGAGRTDAGVHAVGQVAHFDTRWSHETSDLGRALNAVLPADVAVREVVAAPPGFHARYSALARSYRYSVWTRRDRSPLARRTTYHVPGTLAVPAMSEAGRRLLGEHDFGGFGKPTSDGGSTVRRMDRMEVWEDGQRVVFELEANAFLRHQVRRTVGLLLDVGCGRIAVGDVDRVLARLPDAPAARRVPPQGLLLAAVRYPPDDEMVVPHRLVSDTGSET